MRRFFLMIFSVLIFGCSKIVEQPKNLIDEKKMSEIIAEFAINEQISNYFPNSDMENTTKLTLKKFNVKGTDFSESYKYYIAEGSLEKILDNAQNIILEKNPEIKKIIEKNKNKVAEKDVENEKKINVIDIKNFKLNQKLRLKKPIKSINKK